MKKTIVSKSKSQTLDKNIANKISNRKYNKKQLIIVLGMHRSGTSAITRALQVLDIDLGDNLMLPQSDNIQGFWEDMEINSLNIELLKILDKDWHHLTPITDHDVNKLRDEGYFVRAINMLRNKFSKSSDFGIKDPRLTKLLPFWKHVFTHFEGKIKFILAIRNPLSVVKSLEARNNFDHVKSYLLWLDHMLASLTHSSGYPCLIMNYDRLMLNPEDEIRRLADFLALSINNDKLNDYLTNFLDTNLQHHSYQPNDLQLDTSCPKLVHEVYSALEKIASNEQELEDIRTPELLERWLGEFDLLLPILRSNDRLDNQLKELDNQLKEKDLEISNLIVQKNLADEEITRNNSIIAKLNKNLDNLSNEINRYREWKAELERQLNEEQEKIAQIYQSTSWKVSLPVREAKRWLINPLEQSQRYLEVLSNYGRLAYSSLPISGQTRIAHRSFIAQYFPWLLRANKGLPLRIVNNRTQNILLLDKKIDPHEIELNSSLEPEVSIIIPVYGNCSYTLRCLASIAENAPAAPHEVIVVNDCSPDDTEVNLHKVNGIRLISNHENRGFIRSCNSGAKAARGKYLHFLNNDTVVLPGWLDALITTFHEFPGTGLSGSKLIYPDGSLQEAGGIIWKDGSAWNFGRNQDPDLPFFCYAREVDYCSGASIMVPKNLFDELGGFDEHYLPAYCEDSDLALKIRTKGYRVIYQPLSTVVHFEGITSGTDTNRGAKAYQVENMQKQYRRWQDLLKNYQPNGIDIDQAKDRAAKRRALIIDHCTPTPNQDSGSIDIYNIMLFLREMGYQVTFIPEDNFLYMPEYTTALQRVGIEMIYAPYYTSVEQHIKDTGNRYDLVILLRIGVVERHLKSIKKYCQQAKVLFHTVDLHYLRLAREAELHDDADMKITAERMKESELSAISAVDTTTVVSSEELKQLNMLLPDKKIYCMPFSRAIRGTKIKYSDRRDIVFVGGFQHNPNVDAVLYFIDSVMPLLRERLTGVCFYIVGSKPPEEILRLADVDVIVKGFVEELEPLLDRMRINVAPLRYGAGIKGKIGGAMSVGLPSVATSLAVEGMSLTDGTNILVADGAEEFSEAVVRLYQDEALWNKISENGLRFAELAWGGEAAWDKLNAILSEIGLPSERSLRPLTMYSPNPAG